jgi:hypothetical protein
VYRDRAGAAARTECPTMNESELTFTQRVRNTPFVDIIEIDEDLGVRNCRLEI